MARIANLLFKNEPHRSINCCHGDVRLMNGSTPNEGRVEVCLSWQWKIVCWSYWDSTDAGVVCTQLGFSRYSKSYVLQVKLTSCTWCVYIMPSWIEKGAEMFAYSSVGIAGSDSVLNTAWIHRCWNICLFISWNWFWFSIGESVM